MSRPLLTALVASALSMPLAGQRPTVFRSNVDLVSVPVLVRDRNRPVAGLTARDFQVLDNGVPQQLTSTAIEVLPVDVTLVLDTSGSVGRQLNRLKTEIQEIADDLQANDRVRLLAFSTTVAEIFELQPGGSRLPLDKLTAGGGTALYNALAGALMSLPDSTRPQFVFAFSDGIDTVSFLDADRVVALAGRTSALLCIGLVRPPQERADPTTDEPGPSRRLLQETAARTGGALVEDSSGVGLSRVFAKALEEFRTSYMLRYAPQGVPSPGWHDIVVKVTRPGKLEVRARRGYQGG